MQKDPKRNINAVKQLEIYRLENRLSLQALADEVGVSFSTVSRWFSGKTKPHKTQLYHIVKFLQEKSL